jgi:peptidyl-prolyl cis-trans isomerase B (cyclophilin B)
MRKRINILSICIVATMIFAATIMASAIPANFSDVNDSAWFYKDMLLLVEKGGISGYPDGTFKPDNNITVAEFLKIVVGTALGEQEQTGQHWASGYISKAEESGVVLGGEFSESDYGRPVTRQEMAMIIGRLSNVAGTAGSSLSTTTGALTDVAGLTQQYKPHVEWCVANGVITGYPDNTFKGSNNATRAEAATMVVRLIDESRRVGASQPAEPVKPTEQEKKMIKFSIEMENGDVMSGELYPDIAPETVANFVKLAESGFYDGTIFHRVIPGFMIQGGDPEGTGTGGPGYNIKGEFSSNGFENNLKHERGILSMARAQDPNSAGSQFFIMVANAPYLDGQYAAFGKITEGLSVADKIVGVDRDSNDKPGTKQVMKKVTIAANE